MELLLALYPIIEIAQSDCRELGKVSSANIWKIELDVEWVIAIATLTGSTD
jgi:hypothetical protein